MQDEPKDAYQGTRQMRIKFPCDIPETVPWNNIRSTEPNSLHVLEEEKNQTNNRENSGFSFQRYRFVTPEPKSLGKFKCLQVGSVGINE